MDTKGVIKLELLDESTDQGRKFCKLANKDFMTGNISVLYQSSCSGLPTGTETEVGEV